MALGSDLPMPPPAAQPPVTSGLSQHQPPTTLNALHHEPAHANREDIPRTQDDSPCMSRGNQPARAPQQSSPAVNAPAPFSPRPFTPSSTSVNNDHASQPHPPMELSATTTRADSAQPATTLDPVLPKRPTGQTPSSARVLATSDTDSDFDTERDLPGTFAKIAATLERPKVLPGGALVP